MRWVVAILLAVLAVVVAAWLHRDSPPIPNALRAERPARSVHRTVVQSLDAPRTLWSTADEVVYLYPQDTDPAEAASRWSVALSDEGLRKTGDTSRPGRTVLHFGDGEDTLLLVSGRTTTGPFVAVIRPDSAEHWGNGPDAEAPAALAALLPRPQEPSAP